MDRPNEIGEENRLLGDSCAAHSANGKHMQYDIRNDISYVNCAHQKNCEVFIFCCELIVRKFDVLLL